MLKKISNFFLLIILCVFLPACSSEDTAPLTKKETNSTEPSEQGEDLSAILKTVDLEQGEGGLQVWRLKAEWANMQKESGNIFVDAPKLTYFMPPPDKGEILITSKTGAINQKEQILRFIDDVEVNQEGSLVHGDLLIYDGTAKTMTFPDGGVFTGEGMSGAAPFLRWYLNESRIEATGGVDANFQSRKTP